MEENEKFARDPIEVDQQLNNSNNQSTSRSLDAAEIYPDPKQKQETQPTKLLSYSKTKKRGISWWYFPAVLCFALSPFFLILTFFSESDNIGLPLMLLFCLYWGVIFFLPVFVIRLFYRLYKKYKN